MEDNIVNRLSAAGRPEHTGYADIVDLLNKARAALWQAEEEAEAMGDGELALAIARADGYVPNICQYCGLDGGH